MMLSERILDFMDGTLAPDDEAELLHTLSVSPEKRGVLRNFMQQKALFAKDREAMAIPYAAEQSLWAKIDAVLPAPVMQAIESAPVAVRPVGFMSRLASHAMSGASAAIGAAALLVGLGIGYFATPSTMTTIIKRVPVAAMSASPANNSSAQSGSQSSRIERYSATQHLQFAPFGMLPSVFGLAPATPEATNAPVEYAAISNVQPVTVEMPVAKVGEPTGNPMSIARKPITEKERSLLSRFEFQVDESFGRQFPNTVATNVSLPLITNSSVGAYFQVLPHSNTLWAGASYGAASVTKKQLFARGGNAFDPLQGVLAADTAHVQASYIAALAQLRFPAFAGGELTFTGGYGFALDQGQMMIGELGLHYDLSREVGLVTGLRIVRFTYDLSAERDAAIRNRTGSLAVPNGIDKASASINTELNTGLYFHF